MTLAHYLPHLESCNSFLAFFAQHASVLLLFCEKVCIISGKIKRKEEPYERDTTDL